eukprot:132619-Pelagomonas_calceolata.AAC.4
MLDCLTGRRGALHSSQHLSCRVHFSLSCWTASQVDEEPSIRANTTVLLGNLAGYLGEATCKRVLLNAFTRALKHGARAAAGAAPGRYLNSRLALCCMGPEQLQVQVCIDCSMEACSFIIGCLPHLHCTTSSRCKPSLLARIAGKPTDPPPNGPDAVHRRKRETLNSSKTAIVTLVAGFLPASQDRGSACYGGHRTVSLG